MKTKRWAVGSVMVGKGWDDLVKRVFNTYEAAMSYVDELNSLKTCSLVIVQNNEYFRTA
jgi:hypothetical protein